MFVLASARWPRLTMEIGLLLPTRLCAIRFFTVIRPRVVAGNLVKTHEPRCSGSGAKTRIFLPTITINLGLRAVAVFVFRQLI